jgi:hypothetical protein
VNFGDPFGQCPEDVGGDGQTDAVDDCPEDVRDAWAATHIHNTSTNNTDIAGLDAALYSAIVLASMELRAHFGISAGREGGHSVVGGHAEGRGVDINQVNFIAFNSMPREYAAAIGNQVAAEIVNRLPYGRTQIVATPGMAFRTDVTLGRAATLRLMRQHWHHVHVTIRAQ